jgi:tRNA G10  N-methylase Trm11
MNFCILGSHPDLSAAEISAVLSNVKNTHTSDKMLVFESISWDADWLMSKLGGTIKLGDIIYQGPLTKLNSSLIADLLAPANANTEGKRSLDFGLTIYGSKSVQNKFFKLPIQLKKDLRAKGYSVRWVTGKGGEPLSPAAVAKCKLCDSPNADLCLMVEGDTAYLGKATNVQSADAWSKRDYDRPKRDSKNGMLPPKLARMMVNLAQIPSDGVILDPFCGSGTILMEAALATDAKQIIGSDIEAKQIQYTEANNNWLVQEKIISNKDAKRFRVFATDVKDIQNFLAPKSIDTIITEGYLGPPLHGTESKKTLEQNANQILELWIDSLKALRPILKPKVKLVIVTPEYQNLNGCAKVDLISHLNHLGYRTISSQNQLSYSRENQFVKRNILILELV